MSCTHISKWPIGKILAITHGGELVRVIGVAFQEGSESPHYTVRRPEGTLLICIEGELDDNDAVANRDAKDSPPRAEGGGK